MIIFNDMKYRLLTYIGSNIDNEYNFSSSILSGDIINDLISDYLCDSDLYSFGYLKNYFVFFFKSSDSKNLSYVFLEIKFIDMQVYMDIYSFINFYSHLFLYSFFGMCFIVFYLFH